MLALLLTVALADVHVDASATQCTAADGSAAAPFCTLAEGLAAAVDGDRLLVAPGQYAAGSIVTNDVEIVGTGAAGAARIVDVPFGDTLLTIEQGAEVTIDGLWLDGGIVEGGVAALDVRGTLTLLRSRLSGIDALTNWTSTYSSLVTGQLTARETVFANNHLAAGGASALYITGDARVLIEDCLFQDNGDGGGLTPGNFAGAVLVAPPSGASGGCDAQVVIRRTSFIDNVCWSVDSGCGAGGLVVAGGPNDAAHVLVENCTFSGNFGYDGGAIHAYGGATVDIVASTIVRNTTEFFGAVAASQDSVVRLSHSIVDDNVDWIGLLPDGADLSGPVHSLGHNVVGGIYGSPGATFVPLATDLAGVDVALGPLGDLGAFGPVHPLPLGSVAIDVGAAVPPVASDARGVPRPLGLADAGAYERGGFGTIEPCAATPNSTGAPSTITTQGTLAATENDFRVVVESLPAAQFALFLVSELYTFQSQPGGSFGNLCLGTPIVRLLASTQTISPAGQAVLTLDLTQVPTPIGTAPVVAGDTLWFQLWHRDTAPVPGSNFSPAVEVVFE